MKKSLELEITYSVYCFLTSGSVNKSISCILVHQETGACPKDKLRHAFLTLGEPLKPDELDNLLKEYTKGSTVDYKKLIGALVGK